jgi:hypothetical protein
MNDQPPLGIGDLVWNSLLGSGVIRQIEIVLGFPQYWVEFDNRIGMWISAFQLQRVDVAEVAEKEHA